MSAVNDFRLKPKHIKKLKRYLKYKPNNICSGIPRKVVWKCSDILDLLSDTERHLLRKSVDTVNAIFVRRVFEKALELLLGKPFIVDEKHIIDAGVEALKSAHRDLEKYQKEDTSDEERLEIIDWDNGMIACAVIKACGNAAKEALVPA